MMAVISFAVGLLFILGSSVANGKHVGLPKDQADYQHNTPPPFCHGLDCPKFTTAKTTDDYEIRMYDESMWASTEILGMDFDEAENKGFEKLFAYISGDNAGKKKIPMTCPVITRVIPGAGPACESNFTVSFFVPFDFQPKPPKPSAKDVFISTIPKHGAFVRSFPGYAGQDKFLSEAAELVKALENTTTPYDQDYFYTAGYDAPFKPFNRHNEVWFLFSK